MMHKPIRRWMTWLLILFMAFALIPVPSVMAVITITQEITAATSAAFLSGKFSLTGLSQTNGVQLVPLGVLKRWQTSGQQLCYPVSSAGYTSFKTHLYILGGLSTNSTPVNTVCRTNVTSIDGTVAPWTTSESENIPKAIYDHQAIAVPLPTDSNQGVMIVAGGRDISNRSINDINVARINADGSLGTWQTLDPFPPSEAFRAQYSLTAYTQYLDDNQQTSQTFIYAIGGKSFDLSTPESYRSILRATVTSTGGLSSWQNIGNIPVVPRIPGCQTNTGLYAASAVNFDVLAADGQTSRRMLAVIGGIKSIEELDIGPGCPEDSGASADVYIAQIDEVTGNLTWDATVYSLPESYHSMGAIGLNGQMFTTGGIQASDTSATSVIMSSYIDSQLQLPTYAQGNFLKSTTAWFSQWARRGHGMVYVMYGNRPIVYVMGGATSSGLSGYRQDVLFGFLGKQEDYDMSESQFASPGMYVSPAYRMRAPGQITQVKWTASISATGIVETDIQLEYRIAATLNELKSNQTWIAVDGDPNSAKTSVHGENTANSSDPAIGQYIQYRAFLTTNAPNHDDGTPILQGPIIIRYIVDGYPSLFVQSATMPPIEPVGTVTPPTVTLANAVPPGSSHTGTVLDADVESDGTFFVDMYVFPPGTEVITPTRDGSGAYTTLGRAFAIVNKANLPADLTYTIPAESWMSTCSSGTNCPAANWRMIFNRAGTWNVLVVVDSGNNVTEDNTIGDPWEIDNIYRMTVQSNYTGGYLIMPVIRKYTATP